MDNSCTFARVGPKVAFESFPFIEKTNKTLKGKLLMGLEATVFIGHHLYKMKLIGERNLYGSIMSNMVS